jgi:hypothetical protein
LFSWAGGQFQAFLGLTRAHRHSSRSFGA